MEQPDGEIFSVAMKKFFPLEILEISCLLAVLIFVALIIFSWNLRKNAFFSENPSADLNHILCLSRFSAVSEAVALVFLSLPQSSQAAARLISFHLCLLERNMPTAASHQRQQEDELKRLFLYIHKLFQCLLLPLMGKKNRQRLLNSSRSTPHSEQGRAVPL